MSTNNQPPVVCLISLGCAKNTVDSECILGSLASDGIVIAEDPRDADVCLVNTCGFIEEAREEVLAVLNELQTLRREGSLKAVAALGCLVEHAANHTGMANYLKGADTTIGFHDYPELPAICRRLASSESVCIPTPAHEPAYRLPGEYMGFLHTPRARIGSVHTAYLKISEGCSNLCRFCSIPRIRGLQISRDMDELLREARELVASGARELNLVAQDTTDYGRDLYGEPRLPELLERLGDVDPDIWIRVLYAYPVHLTDRILQALGSMPHVCPYLDLPLQHIADPILKSMGRGMSQRDTMALLDRIAERLPHGALRTTFIVGYPGEGEQEFEALLSLVREGRFTHAGVFTYSPEPGTPSFALGDPIPAKVKAARSDALMEAQLDVSRKRLRAQVGKSIEVMIDVQAEANGNLPENVTAVGRTRLDAPEVDGIVLLRGVPENATPGDRVKANVVDSLDYDLVADVTGESNPA